MKRKRNLQQKNQAGFTIVEVMLVLAIAGLMLVGVIAGTYTAIARQRYNDSLRSFAEHIRTIYSEVISPASLGRGNSNEAILGKVVVFGHNYGGAETHKVYSATIIGKGSSQEIAQASLASGFKEELKIVDAKLFCGNADRPTTAEGYTPLWEAFAGKTEPDVTQDFKGSFIIARSPTSGTVHTIYSPDADYNLRDECSTSGSQNASTVFNQDVQAGLTNYSYTDTTFCITSDNSAVLRGIRIAADARNTSGLSLLTDEDSPCAR